MPAVLCLGEALVDLVAEETGIELCDARRFVKVMGGAVANVAIGLARLGVQVRFAGQVGADQFGKFVRASLAGEGVDVRWLQSSPDYPTAVVFVCLDSRRVPAFCFYGYPSADMMYGPDQVTPAMLDGAGWIHFGTVSMVRQESRAATFKLLGLARERGVRVSFDPNLRLHLWRDHDLLRETALAAVRLSDLVKLNDSELEFLTGTRDPAAGARLLREAGPAAAVVTLGAAGAYFQGPTCEGVVPALPVAVVDTTGAGDGFAAGLLSRLADIAWPPSPDGLRAAVLAGNACGGLASAALGATAGLPDPDTLARALAGV